MTKLPARSAAVLAAAALSLAVGSCVRPDPKISITYAEKRGVLESNGLRFVVVPDASTKLVEVDVRYQVGSREDPVGKAGLAHLVEHMMFQLKPDGEGSPPLMHFVGQLSTFFNAYTNWDTTHYMTSARAEQLDGLLKIEAMRLFYGCQTISEDEFLREREVVRNEIRQRQGTAEGQIPQLVLSSVYPKGHAYERMIGGNDAQLTSITLQDACKFIADYYVPENATIIVAGGVDYEQTVELIKKWFGPLPRTRMAPRKDVAQVAPRPGRQEIELDIERNVVAVSWPMPDQSTPEGEYASYGVWGAFFRTAIKANEYEFAYSVQPAILGGQEAPVFSILIELKGYDRLDEALEFVWKGARQAHRGYDDMTWQMFDVRRKQDKADFIANLEMLQARTGQIADAVQFNREVEFGSQEEYILHLLGKYDRYEGEKIRDAVKKHLDPDRATVVVFKASDKGIKGDTRAQVKFETKSHDKVVEPEVDPREAKRPLKVAAELGGLTEAVRYELGNGMDIVLMPTRGSMPVVAGMLTFDVGTAHSSNPLVAEWAAAALSPSMDDQVLSMTGVRMQGFAGDDQTVFWTRALSIYDDVVVRGLERLIKAGQYFQQGVEAQQKGMRESMATRAAQDQIEYQRQLAGALFGADHPYGRVTLPGDAAGFGIDALNEFRRTHYTAGNATLIIAGSFELERVKSLIADAFGGWDRGRIDAPVGAAQRPRTGAEVIGVVAHKPGPQMDVRIAFPSAAGIDGEEAARQVLGEMMNARMGDIRFKLGATYGTYAGRRTNRGPSAFVIGGTVDAERAGEALKAMRDGIQQLRDGSEQWDIDFVRARRKLIQELLGQSTVSQELAFRLNAIASYDLPADHYDKLLRTIAAVSPAQVRALIQRELDPAKEIVVTMADQATLEKAFKDAGLSDFKLVQPSYE